VIGRFLRHWVALQKTTGRCHAATMSLATNTRRSLATNTGRLTLHANNNRRRRCVQIHHDQPCSFFPTTPLTTTNTTSRHNARFHHRPSRNPRTHQLNPQTSADSLHVPLSPRAQGFFDKFLANSYPNSGDSRSTVYNEAQGLEEFHIVEHGNDEGMIWIDTAKFEDKCGDM
jgi:hypothetical protein